jgi:hypothetical protein
MIYEEVSGVVIGAAMEILQARLGRNESCAVESLVSEMPRAFISNLSYPLSSA